MKNQLAENMRRFATKNLSEQIPIKPVPERGPIENVLSALDMHIFRLQSDLKDWQAQYKNKLGKIDPKSSKKIALGMLAYIKDRENIFHGQIDQIRNK